MRSRTLRPCGPSSADPMTREARFTAWRVLSPRAAQLAAGGLTRSHLELGPVSADHYCLTQPELTAGRENLRGRYAVVSRRAAACAPPNPSWRLHELEDNKRRAVPEHTGVVTQLLLPDRVKRAAWPS